MKKVPFNEVLTRARFNKAKRFPSVEDSRFANGLLFPSISRKFNLKEQEKIFTIGSCFARNIEKYLLDDFTLPTRDIDLSGLILIDIGNANHNRILNEFNAGTMSQRINWALDDVKSSILPHGLFHEGNDSADFLIPKNNIEASTPLDMIIETRSRIDNVYSHLKTSDVLFLTLGLTEAWYDEENKCYLNAIEPSLIKKHHCSDRFFFTNLNINTTVDLLSESFTKVLDTDIKKIIITVSPVPLFTTFFPRDAVISSSKSKSMLKIAAHRLADKFKDKVDYFPSYEIVKSGGTEAFRRDNIHVKDEIVEKVINYFIKEYIS